MLQTQRQGFERLMYRYLGLSSCIDICGIIRNSLFNFWKDENWSSHSELIGKVICDS